MGTTADPAANAILRATVGYDLAPGAAWPTEPPSTSTFAILLAAAADHRILGTLAHAVANGELALSPEHRAELADHHASAQAHVLELERTLLHVADSFADKDIDFRVLKGVALAHRVYDDPTWRVASDVDVLVPSAQLDAAVAAVIFELGGTQAIAELRPGFDHEFGKESMVRVGTVEVDLHRTFVTGPFGLTIDLDHLFRDHAEITIGTQRLPTLDADLQFLHACYNVALGDFPTRLGSVRDLLLCLTRLTPDLDKVVAIAARWHGTAVVQRAAAATVEEAGAGFAAQLASLLELSVPWGEALLLRSYTNPGRSYWRPLASIAVIPGLGARARYARAILAPSTDYLRSRGWSKGTHVRRAVRWLARRG